ncbi:MAG TPA: response regulator [Pyrinomonadaceae bacterium]|nr:response regulator [Pyrinomonadaceae bacterium]
MINILFVDDEPNILDGLQRMLRSMRREWQMFFARNGFEALEMLKEKKIDVIVSDMKMPGMDGAKLLHEVRTLYPNTVRIILSGYSEKEMIMKSITTAHQYLAKPCDSDILKLTVSRACALRDLLLDEKLRSLVSQMRTVPSLPTLYSDLVSELNNDEPSMRHIAEIVKKDIGMTVKVLQIVNSAFFGLRRNITNAHEALDFLGLETIMSLTLGIGVFSQFEKQTVNPDLLTHLWEHSIKVGKMAQAIAEAENPKVANDAFTAGILHDIGEVVLAFNLPEQFRQAQELVTHENMTRQQAEKIVFEATHSEVGAYLLGLWGLPNQVVEAIAFHHSPSAIEPNMFSPLTAVHIANAFERYGKRMILDNPDSIIDTNYLRKLNLTEKLPEWLEICANA